MEIAHDKRTRQGRRTLAPAGHDYLPGEKNIPRQRRIFVNRNLRMDRIEAIGFDMDHTLAQYNRGTFEQLTHDLALERLVLSKGYPGQIRRIRYNPEFVIRGLVVDKRHGNFLKMNFHDYIARVYHGTRPLPKEQRRRLYRRSRIKLRSERYQSFDTLFSLPEGSLYAALVDRKEEDPEGPLRERSFAELFDDVRACVDEVHRDGSLKSVIVRDLPRYFQVDPGLRPTLLRFRASGKRVFLLTNSEHDYTEAVMRYLLNGEEGDWKDLFDLVIVEAGKPHFFVGGRPPSPIPAPECRRKDFVFRGGTPDLVSERLGASGDQVLYFGDHTYGDILRSKKSVGWRTAMIVEELDQEIRVNERLAYPSRELADLVERNQALSRDHDQLALLVDAMGARLADPGGNGATPPGAGDYLVRELALFAALGTEDRQARLDEFASILKGLEFLMEQSTARIRDLEDRIASAHNPYWGRLFREGNENSRFGRQVKEFACIYTSRVTNFLNYSSNTYFIAPEERLPHEL